MDSQFGVDIGGTLAKVAYIDTTNPTPDLDFVSSKGKVHFASFQSSDVAGLIQFLKDKHFASSHLNVTGGGAFKYSSEIEAALNTTVNKIDEFKALQLGFSLIVKEADAPAFVYDLEHGKQTVEPKPLPSLICNIGSGVSILKVTESTIERVSGTCLGGGTVLGLGTAILGIESYQQLLEMCEQGDAGHVDLSFHDIYGGDHPDTLAVSLGKLAMQHPDEHSREDIARSLVNMVAYNIGHIASLAAKIHGIDHVYFAGNFIRNYHYIMDRISFGLTYWSKGHISPLFLKHDGFFGALGALVS